MKPIPPSPPQPLSSARTAVLPAIGRVFRTLYLDDRSVRRQLAISLALAVVTLLAGLLLLGVSGWFITATAAAGLSVAAVRVFDVFVPSATIRLMALLRTASRYGERLFSHDATLGALAALRSRLFVGWSGPEAARALIARPARLLFRLTADVDALDGLLLRLLMPALLTLIAALAVGLALGLQAPWAGLLIGAGLLLSQGMLLLAVGRAAGRVTRRRVAALEALRMRTIDVAAGQVDLRMAGRLQPMMAEWLHAETSLADADHALNRLDVGAAMVQALIMAGVVVGGLLVLAGRIDAGAIDVARAAFVLFVLMAAAEPLAALRRGAIEAGRISIAARRIGPRLAGGGDAGTVGPAPGAGLAIDLGAVRVCHPVTGGRPITALQALSLQVPVGQFVAVVGRSGAGKSTLLSLLAGESKPVDGWARLLPATRFSQRTELFQDSLRDNLRLAAPAAADARLWTVLEAAGLMSTVIGLPAGLDTRLGEGGLGLSSGQARRLALARLLLRDTPLWLLDEPTEGLDPQTARDVLGRLLEHAAHRTVVTVTHLRREAEPASRLLVLDEGRVIADLARGDERFSACLDSLRSD